MSGTTTPPAQPGSPATQSTAAAANGYSAAILVVACWLVLHYSGVAIPGEVVAASTVVLAPFVHMISLKMGAGEQTEAVPAAPPAPRPVDPPVNVSVNTGA